MLLYDHLMTLPDEYRFVWKAKKSFAKYAFLLNRYAVPSAMLLTLAGTSHTRECAVGSGVDNFFRPDSDLWFRPDVLESAVSLLRPLMRHRDVGVRNVCDVFQVSIRHLHDWGDGHHLDRHRQRPRIAPGLGIMAG